MPNKKPQPQIRSEIGWQLKVAREKLNLSQSQAAKKWDISVRSLQSWEQGRNPRGLYREKLERILARIEK